MKSIEKLRESLKDCTKEAGIEPNKFDTYWITAKACDMLIDEIEAEIERDYMRLPVDADGVPIHVGDSIEYPNGRRDIVRFITVNDNEPTFNESGWIASKCRHVNPRTLEDVLIDLQQDTLTSQGEYCGEVIDADEWKRQLEGQLRDAADEIRKLLGSDGEC